MFHHPMTRSGCLLLCALLVIVALLFSTVTMAQDDDQTPKYEIFAGYQWLHPGGTTPEVGQSPNAPVGLKLPDMPDGFGTSFTYNFVQHLGLEADFGRNWTGSADETTVSLGPKLEGRMESTSFFVNTLLSWNHLTPPGLTSRNGIGAILGGGMDWHLNRHWGIRVFEADYVWAHQNFSDVVSGSFPALRRPTLSGARLRTGLEYYFGYPQTTTPTASCSVQPNQVMVGEPVTANVAANGFNPKHTLTYQWSANGGRITGNNNTASIDTNGIAGGSYTATATVTDPKEKKNNTATCSANFMVKEPPKNPPTMTCSASPSTLQAGGSATITCNCTSPDNVPVNVGNWSASGGSISGSGNTATLNTTGASAGPITVTAVCTDSRGLSSPPASTQVTVENPPPPPAPQASKLSQCDPPTR